MECKLQPSERNSDLQCLFFGLFGSEFQGVSRSTRNSSSLFFKVTGESSGPGAFPLSCLTQLESHAELSEQQHECGPRFQITVAIAVPSPEEIDIDFQTVGMTPIVQTECQPRNTSSARSPNFPAHSNLALAVFQFWHLRSPRFEMEVSG